MAQILVLTDAPGHNPEMIHSEHVDPVHLESAHSADQLIERVAWAVRDAEQAERRTQTTVTRRPRREERAAAAIRELAPRASKSKHDEKTGAKH